MYYFLLLVIVFSNTDNIWHVDTLIKLFKRGSLKDDFVEFIFKSLFTREYIFKHGQFHLFSVNGSDYSLILAWRKSIFDQSLIQISRSYWQTDRMTDIPSCHHNWIVDNKLCRYLGKIIWGTCLMIIWMISKLKQEAYRP